MKEKRYPFPKDIKEKELYAVFIFFKVIILFCLLFFNDYPQSDFEIHILPFLKVNSGVFSHVYPFQSVIISNLLFVTPPVLSLYFAIRFKVIYVSHNFLIKNGYYFPSKSRLILLKILFLLVFIFLPFFLYFVTYVNLLDLGASNRPFFIRDNVGYLFLVSFSLYILSFFLFYCIFIFIFHPVAFLKMDFAKDVTRKQKIESAFRKYQDKNKQK